MAETIKVTAQDVERLRAWYAEQSPAWPEDVRRIMARVLRVMSVFDVLVSRHRKLLKSFQEALGISPKSERGLALADQPSKQ